MFTLILYSIAFRKNEADMSCVGAIKFIKKIFCSASCVECNVFKCQFNFYANLSVMS